MNWKTTEILRNDQYRYLFLSAASHRAVGTDPILSPALATIEPSLMSWASYGVGLGVRDRATGGGSEL